MNKIMKLIDKNNKPRRNNFPGVSLQGNLSKGIPILSQVDEELLERAFAMEAIRQELDTKKEMDKVQLAFSRILMAAAVLTLGLILLSSFEIPYVRVSPEFVKLMINTVIVEIAGIVSLGLMKHLGKDKNEKEE